MLAAKVTVEDFADQPPRALADDEVIVTGKKRFRYLRTPHVPHAWDAGLLFEETSRTLFCSDLFAQSGDQAALTESSIIGAVAETMKHHQAGPLANSMPYTPYTDTILRRLASLKPAMLASMHGPAFRGDCEQELLGLAEAAKTILGTARA
jgi:flavorubredoxin